MQRLLILVLVLSFNFQTLLAGSTEWLPVEIHNGHVLVDIEIDGIKSKAMLDTGAESNAVSKAFLRAHNIKHTKGKAFILEGVYGKSKENLINNLNVSFEGSSFKLSGSIPFQGGRRFGMILGIPFFKSFIVQIDYPRKKYRLVTHDSMNIKDASNLKLKTNSGKSRLTTQVVIDGKTKVNLLFDTGNSGGILFYRPLAESKGWLETYAAGKTLGSGVVASGIENDIIVLPEVNFGPFTLEDVVAYVPSKGNSKNLRATGSRIRYKGILGYDMLKHFLVTIDAKNALAHLQPVDEL